MNHATSHFSGNHFNNKCNLWKLNIFFICTMSQESFLLASQRCFYPEVFFLIAKKMHLGESTLRKED